MLTLCKPVRLVLSLQNEVLPSDLVLPESVDLITSLLTHTFLNGSFVFF